MAPGNACDQFLKKIQNIGRRGLGSPKYAKLGYFRLLFCRVRQQNVQRFITHLQAIVLLINLLFGNVAIGIGIMVCSSSLMTELAVSYCA